MVTVLKRPEGHVLQATSQTAAVTEDYGTGDALFTLTAHGLEDGDYIYAISDIEDYNGFWYVDQISSSTFKLREYATAGYVQWVQDGTVTWYKSQESHGWSAVHLPIVYKLRSDLYPTNEVDTARTVSSFSESYGYTNLVLSGAIGTFEELQFVKIEGTASLDGVYQILDKISTSNVTISLAYGSHDFSGGTVILYYSSYAVLVKVYVGGVLAATIPYVPDADNEVTFSINEIIKGYINQRNNLLLGDLPNNTDFAKEFYIAYAETYDQTDGYTITTLETAFVTDILTGVAVNADLEFKNRHSGFMSAYLFGPGDIYEDDILGVFLTLFDTPVIWPGFFFDLSFLKNYEGGIVVTINGADTSYDDKGEGVYRIPVTATAEDTEICVSVSQPETIIPAPDSPTVADFNDEQQLGTGDDWTFLPGPARYEVAPAGFDTSKLLAFEISGPLENVPYSIGYDFNVSAATSITIRLYDENLVQSVSDIIVMGSSGDHSGTSILTPGFVPKFVTFRSSGGGVTHTVRAFTFSVDTGDPVTIPARQIIDELCLEVSDECYEDSIYLTWLNNLGGFDYWLFTAEKDYLKEVVTTQEKTKNILSDWPKSFGETADTIRQETSRQTREQVLVRSQYITLERLQAILKIKESSLVQIVTSRRDRRTVIVDADSFTQWTDEDNLYQVQFTITYTNDNPNQKA